MKLSLACRTAFKSGDRQRGDLKFDIGGITLVSVGVDGALAAADGSDGDIYKVMVDFREVPDRVLGVYCECPRFSSGYNCKHLWAFLRDLDDRIAGFITIARALNLKSFDPDDLSIGELIEVGRSPDAEKPTPDLSRPQEAAESAALTTAKREAPLIPPQEPAWRKSLAAIRQSQARIRDVPNTGLPTLEKRTQRWIAIRLGYLASGKRFSPIVFTSKRKQSGDWGTPTQLSFVPDEVATIGDATERKAISLLKHEISYRRGGQYQLSFRDELLDETLQALCATQRFGWTLESTVSLTDFHAVQYSGPQPWRFCLQVSEVDSGEVAANAILYRTPQATDLPSESQADSAPREQRSVDQVVAVCGSGAVLFSDEIGILHPDSIHWAEVWRSNSQLQLTKPELSDFIQQLLSLNRPPELELPASMGFESVQAKPTGLLRLQAPETSKMYLDARLYWRYGDSEIPISNSATAVWDSVNECIVQRDASEEARILGELAEIRLHEHYDRYYERPELRLHRKHLTETVLYLGWRGWDIEAEGARIVRPSKVNISVESGEDWFDVHSDVKFGEQSASLPTLLAALRKGERYLKLGDGSQGILPDNWLAKYDSLLRAGEVDGDSVRFRPNQALMLDFLLAEEQVKFDRNFSTWCEKLNSFSGVKPGKQPRSFRGELRDYQKDALGWFKFLNEFQFGGCLADDMGLGKTVQILALLEGRRVRRLPANEPRKPSLAVVPKSLVFNWIEEAARFAPKLSVVDYTGTDRKSRWSDTHDCDLVITTYATMRLDIKKLRERHFDYVILDEAQAIKNPSAQATKAARLLKGDYRLAMTGTPVENHLGDLWSLFDFLNPGMLGSTTASTFTGQENPHQQLSALGDALKPFILRRTKQQVLTELPEKTEQTLVCEMLPAQQKLYNELRDHYRASLTQKIERDGIKQSKIQVLEALLRLRQAACDPRLVAPKEKAKGSKLELLMQHVTELQSEGHKVLVFSQFTSLLALARKELDKAGFSYEYLDGKTKKRAECVKRFQEDEDCRVFLISLKAGGHGLNLTAANYVFILDPWWNPAVEAQAIDRAHRMGQSSPVTAYRLIAKGTVEDKIIKLQESKRELADAIITADPSLISALSISDLRLLFE